MNELTLVNQFLFVFAPVNIFPSLDGNMPLVEMIINTEILAHFEQVAFSQTQMRSQNHAQCQQAIGCEKCFYLQHVLVLIYLTAVVQRSSVTAHLNTAAGKHAHRIDVTR